MEWKNEIESSRKCGAGKRGDGRQLTRPLDECKCTGRKRNLGETDQLRAGGFSICELFSQTNSPNEPPSVRFSSVDRFELN